MGWRRATWVLATVALVAVGCSTAELDDARDTATTTPTTSPATTATEAIADPPPLEWRGCGGGLECAALTVPLRYDDPSAGEVELAVARRPSTSNDPLGPLVVNPGGPGGSGIGFLRDGGARELTQHFDVVSWDPRGVGDSRGLDCAPQEEFLSLDPQPDDDAERTALQDAARRMAEACAAEDAELLPTLTTETAARDLEQLRRALGGQPLNYLGFSYGTHIGLTYASLFPGAVRAMALDGVVDPRETTTELLTGQAVEIERVLGANLPALRTVAARVEADPLPARTGAEVGPGILSVAAFAAIYRTDGAQVLARALDDAQAGDGTALAQLADAYVGSASFGAYLGVLCVDGPIPRGTDEWWAFIDAITRAAPDLGASVGNELLPCAYWPVEPHVLPALGWDSSLPPILLVASTLDAATPLDDAQRVHAALPHASLLIRNGPGHTSYGVSDCARAAITAYLVTLRLPGEGATCPS